MTLVPQVRTFLTARILREIAKIADMMLQGTEAAFKICASSSVYITGHLLSCAL